MRTVTTDQGQTARWVTGGSAAFCAVKKKKKKKNLPALVSHKEQFQSMTFLAQQQCSEAQHNSGGARTKILP